MEKEVLASSQAGLRFLVSHFKVFELKNMTAMGVS